ncbi:MAG: TVP38/TMEM64 family protein [Phycisphaerales bacterium]|nr:MAG: TVP38/TMEM64 family protein [Phycisphaerales bacterium]
MSRPDTGYVGDDQSKPPLAPQGVTDVAPRPLVILRSLWRPLAVICIVALIIVIVQPARLVGEVEEMREWLQGQGVYGIGLFLLIYIVAAVAIVPQAALKIAAGGLFGSLLGLVIASIGSTLGAAACFLIARYVASGSFVQRMKQKRRYRKLDHLTKRHGAVIVAISRLVPVLPGNLVNYAFGLTQVRLATFVFWSWLCMLPGTVVLVVGTDAFVQGMREGQVPWGLVGIVAGALGLMAASVVFAHRQYRAHQQDEGDYADL